MSSEKKVHELFLELLLLTERYSLGEIRELKAKLKDIPSDKKIVDIFDMLTYLKRAQNKKPLRKKSSSISTKYESRTLKELRRNDPDKYAILKPIEEALIQNNEKIKIATIKELVLELNGEKKDVKSRKDAIRVLIRILSKMTKEDIEKYVKSLYQERKEGRLDELANLIMGENNAKIQ